MLDELVCRDATGMRLGFQSLFDRFAQERLHRTSFSLCDAVKFRSEFLRQLAGHDSMIA